jgi:fructose-specific phosphotransferase system IIC component
MIAWVSASTTNGLTMGTSNSSIRWVRLAVAVIVAEIVPMAVLVVAVALLSRGSLEADQVLADELGAWIGPIGGFLMTFLMAWWAGRVTPGSAIRQGFIIGAILVLIDVSILLAMGVNPLQWLFLVSNGVKIAAGTLGGLVASRTRQE